jgi:hypothetical protein
VQSPLRYCSSRPTKNSYMCVRLSIYGPQDQKKRQAKSILGTQGNKCTKRSLEDVHGREVDKDRTRVRNDKGKNRYGLGCF